MLPSQHYQQPDAGAVLTALHDITARFGYLPEEQVRQAASELGVPGDATPLQAIRTAGVDLPTLCYFDGLPLYGACRLCLVTITAPRHAVVAACSYPVEDGLIVQTDAPDAVATRRLALEFLLSRCPRS